MSILKKSILKKLALSWQKTEDCLYTIEDLLAWIRTLNQNTHVDITKIFLEESQVWFMDEGVIRNQQHSFFSIWGSSLFLKNKKVLEQPIILQKEIGYLGILTKEIDGTVYCLMQAKIEPGNINKIQLSPTIQATKSNFTQKHGGYKPAYLEYFLQANNYEIIVDQIQSEQSSRFYKKRNRNIMIYIDEELEILPNFRWITLGQLKKLMEIDNIINMDTRTVLSCIPFSISHFSPQDLKEMESDFPTQSLFTSIFTPSPKNFLPQIYQKVNNYKMFAEQTTELHALEKLQNWAMVGKEFICSDPYPFKCIFCHIEIEGREVKKWTQPLFEAVGIATFGLFVTELENRWHFLIKLSPEIGVMDSVELGPTIQLESIDSFNHDFIQQFFKQKWDKKEGVLHEVLLSEEGGRFYHEQNYNVIIKINPEEISVLSQDYLWIDFATLNYLIQINNCVNVQLRNLLSLLKVNYEND